MSDENIWDGGHKSDDNKNDDFCELNDDAGGLTKGVLSEGEEETSIPSSLVDPVEEEEEVESGEMLW